MQLLDFLRTQAHANRLANHRLHPAMRALSREEFQAPRTSFFPSLAKTLNHILAVDLYYLAALHGEADMERQWRRGAELRDRRRRSPPAQAVADERFIDHVGALAAAALDDDRRARPRRRPDPARPARQRHRPPAQPPGAPPRPGARDARRHRRSQPPQLDEFLMPSEAHFRVDDLRALGWTEATLFACRTPPADGQHLPHARARAAARAGRALRRARGRAARAGLGRRRHDAARGAEEARRRRPARPDVRRASTAAPRPTRSPTWCSPRRCRSRPSAASSSPCWSTPTWRARTCTTPAARRRRRATCPASRPGRTITAVGDHRARRRLRRRRHPHHGEALGRRQRVDPERHQALHHQRRPRRPLLRRRQDRRGPARDVDVHRREGHAGLHGRPRARQDAAGSRPTPPSWCSTTAASRPANLLGEENRGFYSVMKNFQTERIALAAMAVGHCDAGAAG